MFGFVCAICPYITIGAVGIITTVVTVVSNGYKVCMAIAGFGHILVSVTKPSKISKMAS